MESGWGGNRKGSGRKTVPQEYKKKGYTFQLTEGQLKFIESFGGKSRSESLVTLMEAYTNLKKQIDNSK